VNYFLAGAFLATGFLAGALAAAGFFAAGFLAAGFLAAGFLAAVVPTIGAGANWMLAFLAGAFFATAAPVIIRTRIAAARPTSCATTMLATLPVEIPLNINPNATAGLAIAPVTVNVPAANTQVATAIQIRWVCLLFT